MSGIHAHSRALSLIGDDRSHSMRWAAVGAAAIAFAVTLAMLASPLFAARTAHGPATVISIYGP